MLPVTPYDVIGSISSEAAASGTGKRKIISCEVTTKALKGHFCDARGRGMYFLWNLEVTSCGIIGMKHALPVLDSGQSLRSPSSLYTPLWWMLALGEGESLGRMGHGFNIEDSKEKKKLSGSSPSKHAIYELAFPGKNGRRS